MRLMIFTRWQQVSGWALIGLLCIEGEWSISQSPYISFLISSVQNFFDALSYIEIWVIYDIGHLWRHLKREFDIPSASLNSLFRYRGWWILTITRNIHSTMEGVGNRNVLMIETGCLCIHSAINFWDLFISCNGHKHRDKMISTYNQIWTCNSVD